MSAHFRSSNFQTTALLTILISCWTMASGICGSVHAAPAQSNKEKVGESSSKLFEAISGYLNGYHGAGPAKGADRKNMFRGPVTSHPEESNPGKLFEYERNLAFRRIQKGELDLAEISIKRLSAASSTQGNELEELRGLFSSIQKKDRSGEKPVSGEVVNSIGMRLVPIRPGNFTMGSSESQARRLQTEWNIDQNLVNVETPSHKVTITKPYLMGKYKVTMGDFKKFVVESGYTTSAEKLGWGWVFDDQKKHWVKGSGMTWKKPGYKAEEDYPVTMVSHPDAEAFCEWLSRRDGRRYFLPTEAQWEFACRGDKQGQEYFWGDEHPDGKRLNIADRRSPVPWADRTIDDGYSGPSPVGNYGPNSNWLYDMLGNVWEWCADTYDTKAYEQRSSDQTYDPLVTKGGKKKVVRGGNWAFEPVIARNAFRFGLEPETPIDICGFRVAALPAADDGTYQAGTKEALKNERIVRLLEMVKELTAKGRRLEAEKLVKELGSGSSGSVTSAENIAFVRNVLLDMIDVTEDKTLPSFTNTLGTKMVRIPSSAFVMGSSETDIAWAMATLAQGQPISIENEFPFHKVRISRPFFIAATEVTVAQFRTFVEQTGYITDAEDAKGGQVFNTQNNRFDKKDGSSWKNPGWSISDDQPVAMISYNDAQAFVEWLSAKEKLPYKLPTEAQWEYAAKGGLAMPQFPWGDALPDGRRANYADKSTDFEWRDRNADDGFKYVAPVGSYEPNGYGLYDMAGNVLEWVRDFYGEDYYRFSPEIDPEGPGHGENRVMKGGEWTFGPVNLRCAFRGWARPDLAFYNSGFRVAIETSNTQRPVQFANDFFSKEWVPTPDQRAVTMAVSKDKERTTPKKLPADKVEQEIANSVRGVMVIDLSPKSDARKAGLQKGDVIVEYNGVRDLTVERLIGLTSVTKKEKAKPLVVFVRDGNEYSVRTAPGLLGISVMDTVVKGPFKRHEHRHEDDPDKKPLDWT